MTKYSTEEWKSVVGYEGLYEVSNKGEIRSVDRIDSLGRFLNGITRKTKLNNRSYEMVSLYKDGKEKTMLVHRAVANAFIDNVGNKEQVNHIDEDKTNNCVDNLEWCSNEENFKHGTRAERVTLHPNYINRERPTKKGKRVKGTSISTGEVIYLENMHKGKEYGFDYRSISSVCRGKQYSHRGYTFEYAN